MPGLGAVALAYALRWDGNGAAGTRRGRRDDGTDPQRKPGAGVRTDGRAGGRSTGRAARLAAVGGILLALAAAGQDPARAGDPERSPPARQSAGPVFARMAAAFEDGDAAALAALVHRDGLRVTGHNERAGEYSPAQAVYFFRNLFQAHRTLLFTFRMTQDDASGRFARGMADWKRRRVDSERIIEQQMLLVLTREDGQWRLAEINLMR